MLERKRGWILIVEAVLAVLILFGFLFTAISKQTQQIKIINKGEYLYDVVNELTLRAEKNNNIRNSVISNQDVNSLLGAELEQMNIKTINLDSVICDLTESCDINIKAEEVYSAEVIISTNSTNYEVKKLKIFIWE